MAANRIRLNSRNIEKLLKSSEFAAMTNQAARRIAEAAGPDAEVQPYTTDRKAAAVVVPAEQQARDGVLTRAAASAGLEVKQKR